MTIILSTFLHMGCGKGVKNSESPSENTRDIANVASEVFNLNSRMFIGGASTLPQQTYDNDHHVLVPRQISILSGSSSNSIARIYFNAKSNSSFQSYCKYIPTSDGLTYEFQTCYMQEGDLEEINYTPGDEIIQYSENFVILELIGSSNSIDSQAQAQLEVIWH